MNTDMNTLNWNRGQVVPLILTLTENDVPVSGENPKYSIQNLTQTSDNFNKFWDATDKEWKETLIQNNMNPNLIIAGQYEAFFNHAEASNSDQEELVIIYTNIAPKLVYKPELHIFGRNKYTDDYVLLLKKLRINNQSLIRKKTPEGEPYIREITYDDDGMTIINEEEITNFINDNNDEEEKREKI